MFFYLFLLLFVSMLNASQDSNIVQNQALLKKEEESFNNLKLGSLEQRIKLCDKFIQQFPLSNYISEVYYLKILYLFQLKEYAKCLAVLDIFISFHNNYKYLECLRLQFFCLYNLINHAHRNYELLERALEVGNKYEQLCDANLDSEFINAFEDARNRIAYYYYLLMQNAIKEKNYIVMLINAQILISEYKYSNYACEAYFRIIEFLVNQNEVHLLNDAINIYSEMHANFEENIWVQEAKKLFKKFDVVIEESLNMRIQKQEFETF